MQRDLDPELLPWSQQAEQAVLGSLLNDNSRWDQVGDVLLASQFYDARHGLIFDAIGALIVAGQPADMLTVFDALQKAGKTQVDLPYLAQLHALTASAANARRYAQIVAERALMRGIAEGAEKVRELATKPGLTAAQRLDQAQQVLQQLQTGEGRAMPSDLTSSVVRMLDRVQDLADGKNVPAVSTGIAGLDRLLGGGFKGGKQVILAARPSVGKSSLAMQFCITLALAGVPAAFLSQEMGKDDQTDRITANVGRIALDNLITGKLTDDEWSRLTEAVERMRFLPLYLDDQPALTLHDIAAKARMLRRQHGVRLIVLDYLQLCSGKDGDSRHHQIETISRGLKQLSMQLDVCFLTLSQLNRDVEKRTSGRPVLADLKESGAIEEDADVVMLLSRANVSPEGFQTLYCDVPKNRQGKTGGIALGFAGALQQWREAAMPIEPKTPPRRHYTEDI